MLKRTFATVGLLRNQAIDCTLCALVVAVLHVPCTIQAQQPPATAAAAAEVDASESSTETQQLTVNRIFQGGEFNAKGFSVHWSQSAAKYEAWEDNPDGVGRNLVEHDASTETSRILVRGSHLVPANRESPLAVDDYQWSADRSKLLIYTNSQRVWRQKSRGDYWVLDVSNYELRQLGGAARPATLMFAKFSPDGTRVAYVRERNIYVEDLTNRSITQITSTTSDDIINGTFDWVYEEEFQIRDGFLWSPDGTEIAYWSLNTAGVPKFTMLDSADGFYPKPIEFAYPRTGEQNSECRIGIFHFESGSTRWVELPGDLRDNYVPRIEWVPQPNESRKHNNGASDAAHHSVSQPTSELLVQRLNRLQNTNRVFLVHADSAAPSEVFVDHDDAWVDVHDELYWLRDGRHFTWISERDGWRHAYLVSLDGGQPQLLTRGDYDVIQLLKVDEAHGWLYFLASPDNATQKYLYRVHLDGSGMERVTPADQPGTHDYNISADATLAVHSWSQLANPTKIELIRLADHSVMKTLEENSELTEKLKQMPLGNVELLTVELEPGVSLDGWCILPVDFDPATKYPLLVHVYGEPAGQTVLDRWGGSGYLWHQMLAQQGFVVMSFDNRGTPAPKGRAWRKSVYEQVGVLAAADQAAAVRSVLQDRPYLDRSRVGVWGWSGGGSMTLNAMFRYPDLYHVGISIAPVPNQRYYDTIYQERYMGLPSHNVDGYLKGSPIHFAHQLKGQLLLVHGTGDDNCHYQTTEKLIDELVRHKKQFSLMAYPNRTHSIREGEGTTVHLRQLMTDFLLRNLKN